MKMLIREKYETGVGPMTALIKKKLNFLKNEKGLTLIELLAVIVILAIISAIAIPAIGGLIDGTKTKSHDANGLTAISAARFKAINDSPTAEIKYDLALLSSGGYLEDIPMDPSVKGKTYSPTASFVTVKLINKKYTYSVTLLSNTTPSVTYLPDVSEFTLNGGLPAATSGS